jgi:hypothetical protein
VTSRSISLLSLTLVALIALLVPGGAAADPVGAKVTATEYDGGLLGYVTSPSPDRCAEAREVDVYEAVGDRGDDRPDTLVGTTHATAATDDGYRWQLANQGGSDLYAVAAEEPGCARVASPTVEANLDNTYCGGDAEYGFCKLAPKNIELESYVCGSFTAAVGYCKGYISGGRFPFSNEGTANDLKGYFGWKVVGPGDRRKVLLTTSLGSESVGRSHLDGYVPSAGSGDFSVEDGYAQKGDAYGEGPHFFTPDLPNVRAGDKGGPLHIDYRAGCPNICHDYIHIDGFLLRK